MTRQHVYVGTYTDDESEGLYTYEMAITDDGLDIQLQAVTPLRNNPSFLTAHPDRKSLYAVHEVDAGGVTALKRDAAGSLQPLGRESSGAGGPCHCSVHPSGDYLFVAHYTDAVVSVLPIHDDGDLSPPIDTVTHEGSSVHPTRQSQSYPHSVTPGPEGRYLYVPDLGTDEILVYEFDGETLQQVGAVATRSGAGPRHLEFHPSGRFVYVSNELDSTLTVFERVSEAPLLTESTTISTLPDDYNGENTAAEIHVHPSGDWVYASNRGHDSIVVCAVNQDTGDLTVVGHQSSGGEWPRHFAFDVTGTVLLAENQYSDSIVGFHIDETTGIPEPTDDDVAVPTPVCLYCVPARTVGDV